jgi:hypothetical protein
MPSRSDEYAQQRENIETTYATAYPTDREAERKRLKAEELAEVRRKAKARGWKPKRRRKAKAQEVETERLQGAVQTDVVLDQNQEPAAGNSRQPEWDLTPAPPLAPPTTELPDDYSGQRGSPPADSPDAQRLCTTGCGRFRPAYEFYPGSKICRACERARRERWQGRGIMVVNGIEFPQ